MYHIMSALKKVKIKTVKISSANTDNFISIVQTNKFQPCIILINIIICWKYNRIVLSNGSYIAPYQTTKVKILQGIFSTQVESYF